MTSENGSDAPTTGPPARQMARRETTTLLERAGAPDPATKRPDDAAPPHDPAG